MAGRPRKPSALRTLEGNRSRTAIPPELPLTGVPECPQHLTGDAREHFESVSKELIGTGIVKWLDTSALAAMAQTWGMLMDAYRNGRVSDACKLSARWLSFAGRFGLTPADRAKIMATPPSKPDEDEERFFRVTG